MMQSTFAHFADAGDALHELRDLCAKHDIPFSWRAAAPVEFCPPA